MTGVDTSNGELIVRGIGPAAPGAIGALAVRLAAVVKVTGLTLLSVKCSRTRGSSSAYIAFTDARGRAWRMRVADHPHPPRCGDPHFDLVSRDGVLGEQEARDFLARVAFGVVPWFDANEERKGAPAKVRRRLLRANRRVLS